jgi:LPXTG-site transpeptidase (sortase) family protein
MSLRINSLVGKIPQIILVVLVLFTAGCLVKVTIWERNYYDEKEGSVRASVEQVGVFAPAPDNVDETDITDTEIRAHIVAPDKPRYLVSAFMGQSTKARIHEVGLSRTGAMATLPGIFDVAWYRNSSKPGEGGTILMNGHNGGPTKIGIFKYLDRAQVGDTITIERGDGTIFNYEIYENKILPLEEANTYMSTMQTSPIPGRESLSLISCTGDWSQQQRTYLSRAMVRAVLVEKKT